MDKKNVPSSDYVSTLAALLYAQTPAQLGVERRCELAVEIALGICATSIKRTEELRDANRKA